MSEKYVVNGVQYTRLEDVPERYRRQIEKMRALGAGMSTLGEIRTDIAIYRRAVSYGKAVLERQSHKGAMPATESGGYGVPQEVVLPITTVPFLGKDFACPNQAKAYLGMLYGDFQKVEYTYVDAVAAKARTGIVPAANQMQNLASSRKQ